MINFDFVIDEQVQKAGMGSADYTPVQFVMYDFYMFVFVLMLVLIHMPRNLNNNESDFVYLLALGTQTFWTHGFRYSPCFIDFVVVCVLFGTHSGTSVDSAGDNAHGKESAPGHRAIRFSKAKRFFDKRDDDDDGDDRKPKYTRVKHDWRNPKAKCGKPGCGATHDVESCCACCRPRCIQHVRNGYCENCFMVTVCGVCEVIMTMDSSRLCGCGKVVCDTNCWANNDTCVVCFDNHLNAKEKGKGKGKGDGKRGRHGKRIEGDWFCPGCGEYQFARNDECRSCQRARPKE